MLTKPSSLLRFLFYVDRNYTTDCFSFCSWTFKLNLFSRQKLIPSDLSSSISGIPSQHLHLWTLQGSNFFRRSPDKAGLRKKSSRKETTHFHVPVVLFFFQIKTGLSLSLSLSPSLSRSFLSLCVSSVSFLSSFLFCLSVYLTGGRVCVGPYVCVCLCSNLFKPSGCFQKLVGLKFFCASVFSFLGNSDGCKPLKMELILPNLLPFWNYKWSAWQNRMAQTILNPPLLRA